MAYEFNGMQYQKASEHQKEWGLRLVAELNLQGNEQILDLGCGDGWLTSKLAELVPHGSVTGIDASEGMLSTARQYLRPNLHFVLQDINTLEYDMQFDVVFSNATLHWIKDHSRFLVNVWQALDEGGVLRFNFAGDGNCSNFYSVVREVMDEDPYKPCFTGFQWPWYMPRINEYEALVKQCDFDNVRIWEENADRYFADAEAMTRWIDQPSLVPFLAHLPTEIKTPFRDEVVDRMIDGTIQPDGRCFETFRRLNVSARKPMSC